MKICLAQTRSRKGSIHENIATHLEMAERAIVLSADVIIFPELSITNYEPDLAKVLACDSGSSMFDPFQEVADIHEVTIGVGMPTIASDGIRISMIIFSPGKGRVVYSKQLLHSDELPYFSHGNNQVILNIRGVHIAIGICYETLQRSHFANAKDLGADVYVASVAKPKGGVEKAYAHFPAMAQEFGTPVLMANCVGPCDNFTSVGLSAAWSSSGALLAQLDDEHQGLLVYDTETGHTEVQQFD